MTTRMFSKRLYEILKPFRRTIATIVFMLFVAQLLQMASPYILGRIVNAYLGKAPMAVVVQLGLLGLVFSLSKTFSTLIREQYETNRFDFDVQLHLSGVTMAKVFRWSIT